MGTNKEGALSPEENKKLWDQFREGGKETPIKIPPGFVPLPFDVMKEFFDITELRVFNYVTGYWEKLGHTEKEKKKQSVEEEAGICVTCKVLNDDGVKVLNLQRGRNIFEVVFKHCPVCGSRLLWAKD